MSPRGCRRRRVLLAVLAVLSIVAAAAYVVWMIEKFGYEA